MCIILFSIDGYSGANSDMSLSHTSTIDYYTKEMWRNNERSLVGLECGKENQPVKDEF